MLCSSYCPLLCIDVSVLDVQVDFATNTHSYADAAVEAQRSLESVRTAEAATAISKDAGVLCGAG